MTVRLSQLNGKSKKKQIGHAVVPGIDVSVGGADGARWPHPVCLDRWDQLTKALSTVEGVVLDSVSDLKREGENAKRKSGEQLLPNASSCRQVFTRMKAELSGRFSV